MGLDIKYNYPHAFFLSVAVITFIFGFYPFYINNFNFSSIHWTRILIHGILIIISIVCLWKGFILWGDKERKRKEFEDIRKKRMEQELDINKQRLEEYRLNNQIKELTSELDSLKSSNKEERKRKEIEIEKLKKEILEKKQEINKAKSTLYDLKKDEISKLPDNFSSSALTFSGASCFPIASSGASMLPVDSVENSYLNTPTFPSQKKCRSCGAQLSYTEILCPKCGSYNI